MIHPIPSRSPREYLERLQAEGHQSLPMLVSTELLLRMVDGVSPRGRLVLSEIGEPDRDGFFMPTFTIEEPPR